MTPILYKYYISGGKLTPAGAYLTTVIGTVTCLIWGAGAPAKTKKCGSPEGEYIFSGKGPTFPVSCKKSKQHLKKILKKKEDTTMGFGSVILEAGNNRFGGYVYGRWKQKI